VEEHVTGEHTAGEHTAGEHTAGEHTAGEHTASEHTAGEHTAGEHTAGLAVEQGDDGRAAVAGASEAEAETPETALNEHEHATVVPRREPAEEGGHSSRLFDRSRLAKLRGTGVGAPDLRGGSAPESSARRRAAEAGHVSEQEETRNTVRGEAPVEHGVAHPVPTVAARSTPMRRWGADGADASDANDGDGHATSSPGGDASLATLKWQMYVGWVAILALCGAVVGRRVCGRGRAKRGGIGGSKNRL